MQKTLVPRNNYFSAEFSLQLTQVGSEMNVS